MQKYEINFVDFLTNKKADFNGRFLQDIWNYSDIEIEHTHDFIQILFPLNEESSAVFNGVFLDSEEIIKILKIMKLPKIILLNLQNGSFLSWQETLIGEENTIITISE